MQDPVDQRTDGFLDRWLAAVRWGRSKHSRTDPVTQVAFHTTHATPARVKAHRRRRNKIAKASRRRNRG